MRCFHQHLPDEVVAKAETEAFDAQDPSLTEALELLAELCRVRAEYIRQRLGLKRLVDNRGRY